MRIEGIGLERDLPDPGFITPKHAEHVARLSQAPTDHQGAPGSLVRAPRRSTDLAKSGGPTTIGMARDPEKETTRAKVMQNSVRAHSS